MKKDDKEEIKKRKKKGQNEKEVKMENNEY